MFRRVIQSAIDKGRLRFSKDQLMSIGVDGKHISNRLTLADSPKDQRFNVQERDVDPSSEDKVVVHELQIEDNQEDNNVITISENTRGPGEISPTKAKAD